MKAQGYEVNNNVLKQDNKSAILMEKNGKMLSGKRTRHINIRYFFITDQVSKGKVSIEWCPMADMVADIATKPLQSALFKRFRDQIMGVVPMEPSNEDDCTDKTKPMEPSDKGDIKRKPRNGKKSLVPQQEVPQECVGGSFKNNGHAGITACCIGGFDKHFPPHSRKRQTGTFPASQYKKADQ